MKLTYKLTFICLTTISDIQTQRNYTTCNTDITPLDFLLWGYIKDVVYHTKVKSKNDLKERINAAVETIDEEMLKRTWTEIEYYLDVLHATNGAHIEIY